MRTFAHAVVLAVVGVLAFVVGARNGALGTIKWSEAQAARTAARRAAVAADARADGE